MNKGLLALLSFLLSVGFLAYQGVRITQDTRLKVVFCDVGQGDAIFIRTPKGNQFLIDGGPQEEKLHSCLLSHLPFWDRTIDAIFLTHPHLDHLAGLESVIQRYSVSRFDTEKLTNNTDEFLSLMTYIAENNVPLTYIKKGDSYQTADGVKITVLGPSQNFLSLTAPTGEITESEGFANLILLLEYHDTSILFTGDSQVEGLKDALEGRKRNIDIIHIPHHGSRSGLNQEILSLLTPEIAVISVGRNKYGHPSKEILSLLEKNRVTIYRTDKDGEIRVSTHGKDLTLESRKGN